MPDAECEVRHARLRSELPSWMCRRGRWILSGVALVLLALTITSHFARVIVEWTGTGTAIDYPCLYLSAESGRLDCLWVPDADASRRPAGWSSHVDHELDYPPPWFRALTFGRASARITLPLYAPLLLVIFPVIRYWYCFWRRRKRELSGACASCGYPKQGTSVCPECGPGLLRQSVSSPRKTGVLLPPEGRALLRPGGAKGCSHGWSESAQRTSATRGARR